MGTLHYADAAPIDLDDATLEHLRVLATTRLRRRESFTLAIRSAAGLEEYWVHPAVPLRFVHGCAAPAPLDPDILRRMSGEISATGRLTLCAGGGRLHASSPKDTRRRSAFERAA